MASLADALVRELLDGRRVASLATHNPDGSIHMVAVWYWFDGAQVFVATSSRSRKAKNLQANPNVSLMIDSRDPAASCGITLAGSGQILAGDASREANAAIYRKYLSAAAGRGSQGRSGVLRPGRCHHPDQPGFGYHVGPAPGRSPVLWWHPGSQPGIPVAPAAVKGSGWRFAGGNLFGWVAARTWCRK